VNSIEKVSQAVQGPDRMAGALLGTGLLPSWVGLASLPWGVGWLLAFLVMDATIPGVHFIMPAVIGVALLVGTS
jgi:hypothetical protein